MNKKLAIIGISGFFVIAVSGGYVLLNHRAKEPSSSPPVVATSPLSDLTTTTEQILPKVKTFKASALASVNALETQPECNAKLMEVGYTKTVKATNATGETLVGYNGDWKFSPDWLPTNGPCWKDIYQTARKINGVVTFETSDNLVLSDQANTVVARYYFLPYCVSGQRPGNPAICKCKNGFAGNSGKCR